MVACSSYTGRDALWYAVQSRNRETSSLLERTFQQHSYGKTAVNARPFLLYVIIKAKVI